MDSSPFSALAVPHLPLVIHNVRLLSGRNVSGDGSDGSVLEVEHEGRIHELQSASSWTEEWHAELIGKVGYVQRPGTRSLKHGGLAFHPYVDQTLRRCPHFDRDGRFGWTCDRWAHIEAAPHVIPGEDGAVVRDETVPVTIPVPPEFIQLCRQYGLSAEQLLRAFIADAAEIRNFVTAPREDRYSSNGSDERSMAVDYVERAFGHMREDQDELERRDEEAQERQEYVDGLEAALDDYVDRGGDPRQFLAAVDKIVDGHPPADDESQETTHGQ